MQRPLMTWGCEEGGWGEVGGWATVGCVAGLGVGGWGRLDLDDPRGGWRLGGGEAAAGQDVSCDNCMLPLGRSTLEEGCGLTQLLQGVGPRNSGQGRLGSAGRP